MRKRPFRGPEKPLTGDGSLGREGVGKRESDRFRAGTKKLKKDGQHGLSVLFLIRLQVLVGYAGRRGLSGARCGVLLCETAGLLLEQRVRGG